MGRPTYSAGRGLSREQIARAARMYGSNQEAAAALGIVPQSFGRLCRKYGIDTPAKRRRKARGA